MRDKTIRRVIKEKEETAIKRNSRDCKCVGLRQRESQSENEREKRWEG